MFANTQMGGLNLGFPDICLTPPPPPGIPIPYLNISLGPMAVSFVPKVLFAATPAHNLPVTFIPISFGDEPGIGLGLISHTIKGPTRTITGAFRVLVGGLPCQRLTSINIQNTYNCLGMRVVPSQLKVLVLAG